MSTEPAKKNLVIPTSPMFASIMAPRAKAMVGKLARLVNQQGKEEETLSLVREENWNRGIGNENLAECQLKVGQVGMVVGVATVPTTLRFLVAIGDTVVDGVYHVGILNLEPMKAKP